MSAEDGSSAPTLTVNGSPAVAVSAPVITVVGAVFVTSSSAVPVAVSDPRVTRSFMVCEPGPSSMPSDSTWAQVRVGTAPVASEKSPSPLTSQA